MDVPEAAVAGRGACGCVPVSDKWVSRPICAWNAHAIKRHIRFVDASICIVAGGSAVRIFTGGFDRTFFVICVFLLRQICITLEKVNVRVVF
jgi:hypothetical protein